MAETGIGAGLPVEYATPSGVLVRRTITHLPYEGAIEPLVDRLDARRGVLFASSFEYPGRYTRWDIGFTDPPLALSARERAFRIEALNGRGAVLLPAIRRALAPLAALSRLDGDDTAIAGEVAAPARYFAEEERSRQPSVFSVLRALIAAFAAPEDRTLGLYGAFGYDLAFQFEPIEKRLPRPGDQRDLVLYLPDAVTLVDHRRESAALYAYDFAVDGSATDGLPRAGAEAPFAARGAVNLAGDHAPGEYAAVVRKARAAFRRGDMFEAVPGQIFYEPCAAPPSEVFRRLRRRNPAPYGALLNLGEDEYLVAASPEMFVRVEGRRIETCPISGTIARGADAIGDADRVFELLSSRKDASELTMCTDVDRNDKSRVCVPGTVRVIGRRQIEMYSKLIHTVDHVEGTLADGFDALDGFLSHAWAVTVTGAPKRAAMQFIEDNEKSPRAWYGGAIGAVGFNGDLNTGLTLRTVRIKDGVASVRAGATLLYDSDPESEEAETRLKALAMLDAIRRPDAPAAEAAPASAEATGPKVLMVDFQDSFVHTLGAYLRETGARVTTLRAGFPLARLDELAPDLVVLSPGPGRPADFAMDALIAAALSRGLPLFGVCLGLQGIAEHFGATLAVLPRPMHGKPSAVRLAPGLLFDGLGPEIVVGRYHSLYARRESLPESLRVTAETETGLVMALEHTSLPVAAVQFHPESILTLAGEAGRQIMRNVVARLPKRVADAA